LLVAQHWQGVDGRTAIGAYYCQIHRDPARVATALPPPQP
jgi:hypothetical protein